MKTNLLPSLAMLFSVTALSAAEFRNFGDMTLTGEGDKKFLMKEGRIADLKGGTRYKLSFDLSKAPKVRNAHISVYCYLDEALQQQLNSPKLYSLVAKAGADIPDDGKPYSYETVFTVPDTPGVAEQVRIAAYNSYAPEGAEAVFSNVKIEELPADAVWVENFAPRAVRETVAIPGGDGTKFLYRKFPLENLKKGATYLLKFEMKKDAPSKTAHIKVWTTTPANKLEPLTTELGQELPCDDTFHPVEAEFQVPQEFKNLQLYLYNIRSTGTPEFRNVRIEEKTLE